MSNISIAVPDYTENLAREPIPPIALMRRTADALAQSTNGKVQGNIFTLNPGGSTLFRHTFYLRAPALNDYSYPLFYVSHDEHLYPAYVLRAGGDQKKDTQKCPDSESLRRTLEDVLQESSTRQLVRALLVQIQSQNDSP